MAVPMLDLRIQYTELQNESDALWRDVMSNAAYIGGPRVTQLEEDIASYCGVKHCIACGNGTDALFLILEALGIRKRDEVITTPWTFFATAECIVHMGATPVFVDIEADTYNIDPDTIEAAITPRTKAIIPVDIFGQCADWDAIQAIADRHGLLLIEDACQAIGAGYRTRRAGSFGRAAAFSFFPTKNLGGAGDGGCITTDDDALAERVRLIAKHGEAGKYLHTAFGVNSRLDALQAGLLSLRLTKLDAWNEQRRSAAAYYRQQLSGVGDLVMPVERDYGRAVYHLFMVRSAQATDIVDFLRDRGIGTAIYYPKALHQQEVFETLPGYQKPRLPIAEACANKLFALPAWPGIQTEQLEQVVDAVHAYFD
ncbi:MAG: DegT/DnrJ/EryC1/StrS family aminotransferase [Actinomycetes bacterium]|jgi:dTDP-4-amino-4,6-dideoxygalactose transaminase|nr:DegT/DnrJ/EryC1/StrS family aminotransferase [Actinomycetes bacterium]